MLSRAFRRGLVRSLPVRAAAGGHGAGHGAGHGKQDALANKHAHDGPQHKDHHDDHHHHESFEITPDVYAEAPIDPEKLSFWNYKPDFAHVTPWLVTHDMGTDQRVKRGFNSMRAPMVHPGRVYTTDGYHPMYKVPAENLANGLGAFSYLRIFVVAMIGPCVLMWIVDPEFPDFFITRICRWYLGLGEYSWTKYHEIAVNEGLIQEDDEPDYFGPFDWIYKMQWKKARENK